MDKFEAIRAFTEVVKAKGFAAAARHLNTNRSFLNKLVIQLENELGVQLLHRTTRQVNPTETGLAFYDRCLSILADLEEAEQGVSNLHSEPRGTLRLNAPMTFGTLYLTAIVADFMLRYPALQVQLTLDDRLVDPIAEGFDLVLRIAEVREYPGVIVTPIAPMPQIFCATPSYLQERGIPQHPQDLLHHTCLHYGYLSTGQTWKLFSPEEEFRIPVKSRLCSNNGEVLFQSALKGLGIVLLPQFIVAQALAKGELQAILTAYTTLPLSLSLVYPVNRHLSAKVRLFKDFLHQELITLLPTIGGGL
ncbi:MAG: LysR family transcriptional regulator [Prochlorotrichaceae cyanobacterium]